MPSGVGAIHFFSGFASTNDGVLIAMQKMTTVEYDAATETVGIEYPELYWSRSCLIEDITI